MWDAGPRSAPARRDPCVHVDKTDRTHAITPDQLNSMTVWMTLSLQAACVMRHVPCVVAWSADIHRAHASSRAHGASRGRAQVCCAPRRDARVVTNSELTLISALSYFGISSHALLSRRSYTPPSTTVRLEGQVERNFGACAEASFVALAVRRAHLCGWIS